MYKNLILITFFTAAIVTAKAQDTVKTTSDAPLVFSGSVDTYWKYDFSGHGNIPTSFANDQNSVSIGMIDLGLKKTVGKASFVGELSFGPRGQYQSIPNGDGSGANSNNSFHIQNLYVSYNVTDKLNLSAGYMSTFIGYEVISPAGNFNYSTSYLFTNGPFENAGFKATYTFSDKVSLMAGIFNNYWNIYSSLRNIAGTTGGTSSGDVSTFGAQLTVTPVKGWTAYLNLATGSYSGTLLDLTTAYQVTNAFKLGLNAATKSGNATSPAAANYEGIALYPQLAVSKAVTFGLRGEYFKFRDTGTTPGGDVKALTITANIKAGPLTLVPEVRFDNKSDAFPASFVTSDGNSTNHASQFLVAAVYAF